MHGSILKTILFAFARFLTLLIVMALAFFIYSDHLINHYAAKEIVSYPDIRMTPDIQIKSPNAILINTEDGKILFEKDKDTKVYPASITKVMTAIVAIENLPDLNKTYRITSRIWDIIIRDDASYAGFLPDEDVKYIDLLYGLMLESGADCAIGLAESVAGSEAAFAELMNKKAAELGMASSHFTNPTGLHNDNQYSTVEDLSKLFQYAIQNELFHKIVTTQQHITAPTNIHTNGFKLNSFLLDYVTNRNMGGIKFLGGKTGYTEEALYCLASFAEKTEGTFILVTCGAPEDPNNKKNMFYVDDAFMVYNALYTVLID